MFVYWVYGTASKIEREVDYVVSCSFLGVAYYFFYYLLRRFVKEVIFGGLFIFFLYF